MHRPVPFSAPSKWLLLFLVFAAACSSAPPFDARAVATEWHAFMQRDYVLRAGDHLEVRVNELQGTGTGREQAEVVQEIIISPTGWIELRELSGSVQVGGKTVAAARKEITEAYRNKFTNPRVFVSLTEAGAQSVYVCGEVRRPGPVPFQAGMTMTQAIASAGSFEITVKYTDVRVLRMAPDGTQRAWRVNMEAVLHEESPDFLLLPSDIVYLQTSGIADAGNWVELWVRRLLPFAISGPTVGSFQ
jgi:protein involved in polysaccharide export with SLBB domain